MALGKAYVLGLVKKAPKPEDLDKKDPMAALSGDSDSADDEADKPEEPKDLDGEEAAKASAFDEFLSALGVDADKAGKARAALDEYIGLCGK
jgi:hypothetical protein